MPRKGFLPPSHDVVAMTTDLVPPKLVTSKPADATSADGPQRQKGAESEERTQVDDHLVGVGGERRLEAAPELAERRETGGAHPHLERLITLQVNSVERPRRNLVRAAAIGAMR